MRTARSPDEPTQRLRRLAAIIAAALAVVPAWAVCAAAAAPPIQSASEIHYPPFCIVDEAGAAGGFSVELLRAALAAVNRDVVFRTGPWAEVRAWLERGEVQALPLVGRTPEREALFDFTFPYMSLHGAIVVRTGTTGIRDIGDLADRRVAVMQGDNAEEFMRRSARGVRLVATATFEDALHALSEGRVEAVVIQRLLALRLIQRTGIANLTVLDRPVTDFRQDFCFAVREGDRDTLALLNEGLALMMADGTYRHLHAKWFAALQLPASRRIVIGGDRNYPPFEYLDKNGRPAGYNVALTRVIARAMDLEVDIRLAEWSEIKKALARGEIDAVQGMFYSPERDLEFDFSPPHTMINHVAVIRRADGPPPETPAELTGRRLVVMAGDIMHEFALQAGLGEALTTAATQEDALRQVAAGRGDCALVARVPALYWIDKHGWTDLRVGRATLLSHEYCFAVPDNRRALLATLSEGLKVIEESGAYRRIHNEWLGVYAPPPQTFPPSSATHRWWSSRWPRSCWGFCCGRGRCADRLRPGRPRCATANDFSPRCSMPSRFRSITRTPRGATWGSTGPSKPLSEDRGNG